MEKKRTQRSDVLSYLKRHRASGMTSEDAWKEFGCTRLASHICEFRKRGMNIETKDEYGKDRYGKPTRYARYIYHG